MRRSDRFWFAAGLVAVLAGGVLFRLMWLGDPAFRADTITFFDICHRPLTAWVVFTQWMDLLGRTAQFPFPVAYAKGFIDLLHLPVTDFTIRLPSALWGIATVVAVFFVGRLLYSKWFGVLVALLVAVNPFHIQLSREAYFYPPLLLGTSILAWSVIWAVNNRGETGRFPWYYFGVTAVGYFLSTYSHLSGWWLAGPVVLVTLGVAIRRLIRNHACLNELVILLLIYFIIGLPLLFADWAVPYFVYDFQHPENYARTKLLMGTEIAPVMAMLGTLGTRMTFGDSSLRIVFLVLMVCLAVTGVRRSLKANPAVWVLFLLLACSFTLYVVGQRFTSNQFTARHVSFLLPIYLLLLATGIREAYLLILTVRPSWRLSATIGAGGLIAIVLLLSVPSAIACTQITGKPIPYKEVARWCDTHLPPRTLVLVERWFDPWNELRVHNSTNVYFTFTVPAEPKEVFERNNWPATAKEFFNRFPDAAYLEYANSERNRMGVVSNVYFARQVAFTNTAGIKLAKCGVAYRDDFYDPATNRLITTIFYNTRDDVIRHARAQGQTTLVLYEPSWGYVKLWQQLKDFRDWRVLEDQAALDIYNLTSQTNWVNIVIRGMTINGSKRVVNSGGSSHDFKHLQLEEWPMGRWALRPGVNQIVLRDPLWRMSRIPLLVDKVLIRQGNPE